MEIIMSGISELRIPIFEVFVKAEGLEVQIALFEETVVSTF